MDPIIRSIRRYTGSRCPSMRDERVVVVAVLRGDDALREDVAIGELQADDFFEFVQVYTKPGGSEHTTWVTGDAAVWELGPAEGQWERPIQTTIEMEWRPPPTGVE